MRASFKREWKRNEIDERGVQGKEQGSDPFKLKGQNKVTLSIFINLSTCDSTPQFPSHLL